MRRSRVKGTSEGWLTSYADLITNLLIFFILIISVSQIQTGKFEKVVAKLSQSSSSMTLTKAAEKVEQALKEQQLMESVRVSLTDEGLELSFDSGVTFPSGSADIIADMEEPLAKVLATLVPFQDQYNFAVEGHTDERPVTGGYFKSNWELASARALRVRERLESVGIPKGRIRVEAYADNKLLPDDVVKDLDRDTKLAKHRRVVVRLY